MKARAPAGERGSGSVLTLGVVAVVLTLFVAVAGAGGYLVAAHRARGAADLAALAGAVAYDATADPGAACTAAGGNAAENAVELTGCRVVGDRTDFVVRVEVSASVARSLPTLPTTVEGHGYAGPVPP